jgi:hypothetical protein
VPCVVGHYPFAGELRQLGFAFLDPDDPAAVSAAIRRPDLTLLDNNAALAAKHFSMARMRIRLYRLLERAGWLP